MSSRAASQKLPASILKSVESVGKARVASLVGSGQGTESSLSQRVKHFDKSSNGSFEDDLRLADCGQQIRSGHLEKKIAGTVVTWITQGVVLTNSKICFLIDEGEINEDQSVIDYIPLHEVKQLIVEGENKLETDKKLCLVIRTVEGGYNSGRTYVYRMKTEGECLSWHADISKAFERALKNSKKHSEKKAIGGSKFNWLRFNSRKVINAEMTKTGKGEEEGNKKRSCTCSDFLADSPELHCGHPGS